MYQLIMALITISLFAGLLLAGRGYVDPQRVVAVERAELLLAERNRIDLALRAYRVANGVPAPQTGWELAVNPFLTGPLRALPEGLGWTYRTDPDGGSVCVSTGEGGVIPTAAAPVSCVMTGMAACMAPASVGLIGSPGWTGCEGMLIVDDVMLRAAASPEAGGDGSFAITGPDAQVYTFADSDRDLFTGQVTNMSDLFALTPFSGDVGYWSTSSVTRMDGMARSASLFNAPIGGWDTSRVTTMSRMFDGAADFNRDLSGWCVPLISAEPTGFDDGATSWALGRPAWGTCPTPVNPVTIALGPSALPNAERGVPYVGFDFRGVLTLSGTGPGELTWTGTSVPAGLTLDPEDGTLSGTPTGSGGVTFSVLASHPSGVSNGRSYSLMITAPTPPEEPEPDPVTITLAAGSVPDGERGTIYAGFDFRSVLTLTGADPTSLSWDASALPDGLSLDPEDGTLSGTPTAIGGFTFSVLASHASGASGGRSYTIIINDSDPLIIEP